METPKELRQRLDTFITMWKRFGAPFDEGDEKSEHAAVRDVAMFIQRELVTDFAPIAYELAVALGKEHFHDLPPPTQEQLHVDDHVLHTRMGWDCENTLEAGRRVLGWGAWAVAPREFSRPKAAVLGFAKWAALNLHCGRQPGDSMRVGDEIKPFRRPLHQQWEWVDEIINHLISPRPGKANDVAENQANAKSRSANDYYDGMRRGLALYTKGTSDEAFKRVAEILMSSLTVSEKVEQLDAAVPIPPDVSAQRIADAIGCSATAIQNCDWWKRKRKGKKEKTVAERDARHRERSKLLGADCRADDDES